jgi:3-hydroxymyristoyl/3-hydroxydecanoyl-(acyl carrier protein) dehydratase
MSRETGQPMPEKDLQAQLPIFDLMKNGGRITAKAIVPPAAVWFQGHFPALSILPCVAVTALAVEPLLRYAQAMGRPLKIVGFSRVRIKMLTFPGELLAISIEEMPPLPEAELAFEIACGDNKICQGRAQVAEK